MSKRKRPKPPVPRALGTTGPKLDPETGLPPVGSRPLSKAEVLARARAKHRHPTSPARKTQR